MHLTVDQLRRAPQFTNAMLQREVDLRGLCISSLDENALIMLNNEFDVVNLTSNALTALEYFPGAGSTASAVSANTKACMDRVTTLIAHRNQIRKVSTASCVLPLPNVRYFMADRNNLSAVRDLLFLKSWKKLEVLSLEGNPVWGSNAENFDVAKLRAFIVYLCPNLRLLNYARVTRVDRELAEKNRKEFKQSVAEWESAVQGTSTDGRRLRKRGRENRTHAITTAAGGGSDAPSAAGAVGEEDGAPAVSEVAQNGTHAAADTEGSVQARLTELEERIMASDLSPEEIVALEQEMIELTAEMERRQRRRR